MNRFEIAPTPSFRKLSSFAPWLKLGLAGKLMMRLSLVVVVCLPSASCGQVVPSNKIKLAYVNWADGTALTLLAEAILEEKMGYDVELTMADAAPVFTSVADGGHDAFLDAWLPVTHGDYMRRFEDKLVDLGPNYEGTQIGLVVPEAVRAETINDLKDQRERFGGVITGIDSGAGIMQATEQAIQKYELDYQLLPSSEAAMTARLKEAIDRGEPIVVTGWQPHWMFARWDLRFLGDPRDAYPQRENIHTVVRPGFVEDHPAVARFFRQYQLTAAQLQQLMDQLRRDGSRPKEVARQWMRSHPEVVDRWLAGINLPAER